MGCEQTLVALSSLRDPTPRISQSNPQRGFRWNFHAGVRAVGHFTSAGNMASPASCVGSQHRSERKARCLTLAPRHERASVRATEGGAVSGTKASRFDGLNLPLPVSSLALLVGVAFPVRSAAPAVGMSGLSLRSAGPAAGRVVWRGYCLRFRFSCGTAFFCRPAKWPSKQSGPIPIGTGPE